MSGSRAQIAARQLYLLLTGESVSSSISPMLDSASDPSTWLSLDFSRYAYVLQRFSWNNNTKSDSLYLCHRKLNGVKKYNNRERDFCLSTFHSYKKQKKQLIFSDKLKVTRSENALITTQLTTISRIAKLTNFITGRAVEIKCTRCE